VADSGTVRSDLRTGWTPRARTRNVGFVFQHYALFKHMTVADNIAFGLRVRPRDERPDKDEINKRVTDLLQLVQLAGPGRALSQPAFRRPAPARGAGARARHRAAHVLLLDEPFGALDAKVRKELRAGCAGCMTRPASPACSSPMTRRRPLRSPTWWR
jgi:sulfate transport system ATP-binding protein